MTEAAYNLERVPPTMRGPVQELAGLIRELAGDNAKALTLYGAIVAGTFNVERDTARSVLVVDAVDLEMLRRLATHGLKFGRAHLAAPLIMTPPYIDASRDAFPLELIEIQQQHQVLFGEDHFASLTFEEPHVRLQCERELKAILIGLRQGLLASTGKDKFLEAIEMDVGTGVMRTLRGMLWLRGHKDAQPRETVLQEIEKLTERRLDGLRRALDPEAQHGWEEFKALYRDVETLGELANAA